MLHNAVYNAAEQAVYNQGDGKTQAAGEHHPQLECGPTPNVMAAQPNIGGALC